MSTRPPDARPPAVRPPGLRHYRLAVFSRCLAAIAGGYALAAATAAFVALALPPPRTEAVMAGTLLAYTVHAAAVVWVFAAGNARRAWAGVALPAAVLALAAWGLAPGAAR